MLSPTLDLALPIKPSTIFHSTSFLFFIGGEEREGGRGQKEEGGTKKVGGGYVVL